MVIFQLDLIEKRAKIIRIGEELRYLYIKPRLLSSNGFGSFLNSGKLFSINETDEPLDFGEFNQKIRENAVAKNLIINMSNSSLSFKVLSIFFFKLFIFKKKLKIIKL